MARVQVSTSSVNKNTSVAGNGIASGDGDLNDAVRGSSGGFGVVGTDGSNATTGNFEVLDALPGWYLRDLVVERTARLGGEPITRTFVTSVSGVTVDPDSTGVVRNLQLHRDVGLGSFVLPTQISNFYTSDSESESVTISVGDSISTTAASGVIIGISSSTNTTPRLQLDVKLTRGTTFIDDEVIRFAAGALVNSFTQDEADRLADSDNSFVQPIPTS